MGTTDPVKGAKLRTIQVEERLPLLETLPLSLQHLFAMFGATVLVPFLLNVDPATSLLMNGVGTLTYLVVNGLKKAEGVDVFDEGTNFSPFVKDE